MNLSNAYMKVFALLKSLSVPSALGNAVTRCAISCWEVFGWVSLCSSDKAC